MTAQEFINKALYRANIIPIGQDPDSNTSTEALDTFNGMIAAWKDDGLDLGLAELDADDEVYVNRADHLTIIYNLALMIAELKKLPLIPSFVNRCDELYRNTKSKYMKIKEASIPLALQSAATVGFDIRNDQ